MKLLSAIIIVIFMVMSTADADLVCSQGQHLCRCGICCGGVYQCTGVVCPAVFCKREIQICCPN